MDWITILVASVGISFGGFLKGATGAGAPVVGVPILAMIFDVPLAVAVFSVLNMLSNAWHSWAYRQHGSGRAFVWVFAIAGGLGAALGAVLLASLPTDILMASLGGIVIVYIALRLMRPRWSLDRVIGERVAGAVGFAGGILQGAGGISAPISVTYLNAMKLSRDEFIATISVFFFVMSLFQIPSLASLGILTLERLQFSMIVAVPLFAAIPVGEWAAKRMSRRAFDRIILALLGLIAVRLIWKAVF